MVSPYHRAQGSRGWYILAVQDQKSRSFQPAPGPVQLLSRGSGCCAVGIRSGMRSAIDHASDRFVGSFEERKGQSRKTRFREIRSDLGLEVTRRRTHGDDMWVTGMPFFSVRPPSKASTMHVN